MAVGLNAPGGTEATAHLRVLHVITELRVGGAESQLARLLQTSRGVGDIQVVGVACLGTGGAVADALEASGIRVWRLGAIGFLTLVGALWRLRAILREEAVDVVVAWLYHAMIAAALPGVAPRGSAVVWNVRGTLPTIRDKRSTRAVVQLTRLLASRPARIVYNAASARGEHEHIGYPAARGVVIPNGYPASSAPSIDARDLAVGPPVVLLAARFHPMKDFPTFFAALRRLRDAGVAFRVRVVGEGCDASNRELLALADATSMRDALELGGIATNMDAEYARASVVVSSSAWGEGFQNVLAEASLQGTIVVSTDVGEARALVTDPDLVVPPGDPAALARAIGRAVRLPADAAHARRMAQRDLVASRYSTERMRERYDALCRDAAALKRGAR